jgi:mono/diheme cytochrome c family protein
MGALGCALGCGGDRAGGGTETAGASADESAARGAKVYLQYCTACHHTDPSRDGMVGPAVQGSPRELLEARVLRAEYPPGYTPKRETRAMTPLPQLADRIDDLAAYLK